MVYGALRYSWLFYEPKWQGGLYTTWVGRALDVIMPLSKSDSYCMSMMLGRARADPEKLGSILSFSLDIGERPIYV